MFWRRFFVEVASHLASIFVGAVFGLVCLVIAAVVDTRAIFVAIGLAVILIVAFSAHKARKETRDADV